jgi:DUF4097 and DUF4098 domain-containing protein YvlB
MMKKRLSVCRILAILVVVAIGCSTPTSYLKAGGFVRQAEGSFDRTLNASGTIDLDVATGSGSIQIRLGSGNSVEIHGRIRGSNNRFISDQDVQNAIRRIESNPPIEQSGQSIRIGRTLDRDAEQHISISYEIIAPAQSNLRAHTGSGPVSIDGISGRINTGTGSGEITLRNIQGDLQANTGSGRIQATGLRGGVRMTTGSGGIQVEGEQTAQWELQTGSGGIDVRLPRSASFDLSAHTGSGGISVNFPLTLSGQIDANRRNVVGRVGSGQFPLSARTGSGHIRIE